jgi:hypothetical protein
VSRGLVPALSAEIDKPVIKPFFAVRIELPEPVYGWTGVGYITFADADGDPHSWAGIGDFGGIDSVGESSDGSATGMRVTLLNVPAEFRDDIGEQVERGALFEVYFGTLNETWQQVVATQLIWKGRLDDYRIVDAGDTISVEVTGESRSIDQRRPAVNRLTHEAQQRRSPTDLGVQYRSQVATIPILWAQAEPKGGGASGGVAGGFAGSSGRGLADRF